MQWQNHKKVTFNNTWDDCTFQWNVSRRHELQVICNELKLDDSDRTIDDNVMAADDNYGTANVNVMQINCIDMWVNDCEMIRKSHWYESKFRLNVS